MSVQEILTHGGGFLVVLLTIVQIAPIKINPWSSLAKTFGRCINADVLKELQEVKATQKQTQQKLDDHIRVDDERDADAHRAQILRFNLELIQDVQHTREDYIEVLAIIDFYETYCRDHKDYKNNRAGCAIENIKRCYNDRLMKRDFAQEGGE